MIESLQHLGLLPQWNFGDRWFGFSRVAHTLPPMYASQPSHGDLSRPVFTASDPTVRTELSPGAKYLQLDHGQSPGCAINPRHRLGRHTYEAMYAPPKMVRLGVVLRN